MPKRRVKPYLLPDCPIEYARGIYQGEGSHFCSREEPTKRARLRTVVVMADREALQPLERCFGTTIKRRGAYHVLERVGEPAVKIAQALATTPTRKRQIEEALRRCRELAQKGYKLAY